MSGNIDLVLDFWFGKLDNQLSSQEKSQLWYASSTMLDQQIKLQFEHLYEQALQGHLDSWMRTPKGAMALIILLDQMPRNMFRGTAKAFISDHCALRYCLEGIEQGFDKELALVERSFFYHPLEHAEDLELQQQCVSHFQRMQQVYSNDEHQQFIRSSLDFAQQHLAIITRFGRFPHRNNVLDRESSLQESEYLKIATGFGQTA